VLGELVDVLFSLQLCFLEISNFNNHSFYVYILNNAHFFSYLIFILSDFFFIPTFEGYI